MFIYHRKSNISVKEMVAFSTMLFNPTLTLIVSIIFFFSSLVVLNVWPILFSLLWLWFVIIFTRMGISHYLGEQYLTSPAEGKIYNINTVNIDGKEYIQITIILRYHNIHSQHYPISGVIYSVEHRPGKFDFILDGSKGVNNEKIITAIESNAWDRVKVVQIAGKIIRTITNLSKPARRVTQGHLMGSIFMGSRVDVYFKKSLHAKILVAEGQKVNIGDILAKKNKNQLQY